MSAIGLDISPERAIIARHHDDGPQCLQARDLRQVWGTATTTWGPQTGAVFTASAGGHPGERRGILRHARNAQVEVLRILSAPAAAAFGHWQATKATGTYAVLDLRRSNFDCCVVAIAPERVEVLSAIGYTDLGADAVDTALTQALAEGCDAEPRDQSALRMHARTAREALSTQFGVDIDARLPSGARVRRTLTRHQMTRHADEVRVRWMAACRRAVAEAETTAAWLDGVLVMGFAPMLGKVARRCFHRPPTRLGTNGAAIGAAQYARVLQGDADGPIVLERSTHGLALEDREGVKRIVLGAGTPLPASVQCTPRRGERLIHLDWRDSIIGVEQLDAGTHRLVLDADGVVRADGSR